MSEFGTEKAKIHRILLTIVSQEWPTLTNYEFILYHKYSYINHSDDAADMLIAAALWINSYAY